MRLKASHLSTFAQSDVCRKGSILVTVGALLLIGYTTLFPFDFTMIDDLSPSGIVRQFDWRLVKPDVIWDFGRNVLLFLPWGFGLTGLLGRTNLSRKSIILLVTIVSFFLSSSIEISQLFLTARTSYGLDIISNGLGGCIGCYCFYRWGEESINAALRLIKHIQKRLSPGLLIAGLILYLLGVGLVTTYLHYGNTLKNWNTTYSLVLGNEKTGERPWQGYIAYLSMADTTVSPDQVEPIFAQGDQPSPLADHVVVSYQFVGQPEDLEQTGSTFPLTPAIVRPKINPEHGLHLTAKQWLQTTSPVTSLIEKLADSSQFTLDMVIATTDLQQTGPAQIVSISPNIYNRNLTVSQEDSNLLIRLRTPLTGKNGRRPELSIPNVFQDTNPHHVLVTYDGFNLTVYVDTPQQPYTFTYRPEVMLFRFLLPIHVWQIRLTAQNLIVFKVMFYCLIGGPVLLIVALMVRLRKAKPILTKPQSRVTL